MSSQPCSFRQPGIFPVSSGLQHASPSSAARHEAENAEACQVMKFSEFQSMYIYFPEDEIKHLCTLHCCIMAKTIKYLCLEFKFCVKG